MSNPFNILGTLLSSYLQKIVLLVLQRNMNQNLQGLPLNLLYFLNVEKSE